MEFNIPKDQSSIIKVVGVGGGGSNAVNYMYNQGFTGVDFIVCNTDKQALDISPVPFKIQLGASLTEGRGAGAIPEIGMNAAIENIEDVKEFLLNNTKMVFITAGMGGGTGTGAAPIIAKTAKDLGILTVGIVTVPFNFEGRKRRQQAEIGLENMRDSVDTLLVINNERLREIHGNLTLGNAFAQADEVLANAAKGIADVISVTGAINVDFNDVNTVMKDSGVAIMGTAVAEGENRAIEAVKSALTSPLLNDNDIEGAEYVLLNITYGDKEVLMDEISDITDYIQNEAGSTADVIWGHCYDATLGEKLGVTIIATGFQQSPVTGADKAPEKKVSVLETETPIKEITAPLTKAVENTMGEPYLKSDKSQENTKPVPETTSNVPQFENATTSFETSEDIFNKSEEETADMQWELKTITPETAESKEITQQKDEIVESKEIKRYYLEDDIEEDLESSIENKVEQAPETTQTFHATTISKEEQHRKAEERMERIHNYTAHLNSAEGLSALEKEPAFKRRNIELDQTKLSSYDKNSRFEVSKENDKDNKTTLRDSNSFLHDNID